MSSPPDDSHRVNADFGKISESVEAPEKGVERPPLPELSFEQLATESARLREEVAQLHPEAPWHPAILVTAVIGITAALLYLVV